MNTFFGGLEEYNPAINVKLIYQLYMLTAGLCTTWGTVSEWALTLLRVLKWPVIVIFVAVEDFAVHLSVVLMLEISSFGAEYSPKYTPLHTVLKV